MIEQSWLTDSCAMELMAERILLTCTCPITGRAVTTAHYSLQQIGPLLFAWYSCPHCDAQMRVAGDPGFDPDQPQQHCLELAGSALQQCERGGAD
jgi:hypothetical protein